MMISLVQIFLCGVPLFLEYAGSQLSHSVDWKYEKCAI